MTPSQLTALQAELNTDPLALGYAALKPASPGTVAALLNAPSYTAPGSVSVPVFLAWAASVPGLIAGIKAAAANAASPIYDSANALLIMLSWGPSATFDLSADPVGAGNTAMLSEWVTAGAITSAQQTTLLGLAATSASRATILGLPTVTEAAVHAAWGI